MTNTARPTDHPMDTGESAFVVGVLFNQHGANAWSIAKRMTDENPDILHQLPPSQERLIRAWLETEEDSQPTAEVSVVVGLHDLAKQLNVVAALVDHGPLTQRQIDALHGVENLLSNLKAKAER